MEKMKLPTKADVERGSLDNLFDKVKKNIIRAEDQENYTDVLNKLLAEGNRLYDISASLKCLRSLTLLRGSPRTRA